MKQSMDTDGAYEAPRMKLVIVESPFKGDRALNKRYLECCLRDCLNREESPYASHKMLTDCLDDDDPKERELGIVAGMAWKRAGAADLTVFYVDLGWSEGMKIGFEYCQSYCFPYEVRVLKDWKKENDR